jgi:hypothetical protein
MLDIRALTYVSPVSEVPFASVTLTVRLSNLADETGDVSALTTFDPPAPATSTYFVNFDGTPTGPAAWTYY